MADLAKWRMRRDRQLDDEGSAMVEFIALSLLMLIPLVYLVVTLARIQAGAFAAEAAAHEAARTTVVVGVGAVESGAASASAMEAASRRANAGVAVVADDFGFSDDDATLELTCDGRCFDPGGNIDARVTVTVALPGIPGFVSGAVPLTVDVAASARAPVDSVVSDQ